MGASLATIDRKPLKTQKTVDNSVSRCFCTKKRKMNANSSADAKFRKSAKTGPNQPQKAPGGPRSSGEVPGKFRGVPGKFRGEPISRAICGTSVPGSSGEFRGGPGSPGELRGGSGKDAQIGQIWRPEAKTRRNAQNGSKMENTQISRKSKVFGVNQDLGRMFLTTGGLLRNLNTNCVQLLYGHCLNNNMIWTLS